MMPRRILLLIVAALTLPACGALSFRQGSSGKPAPESESANEKPKAADASMPANQVQTTPSLVGRWGLPCNGRAFGEGTWYKAAKLSYEFTVGGRYTYMIALYRDRECASQPEEHSQSGSYVLGAPVQGQDGVYMLDLTEIQRFDSPLSPTGSVHTATLPNIYTVVKLSNDSMSIGPADGTSSGSTPETRHLNPNGVIFPRQATVGG